MALPVTITGLSTAVPIAGPFKRRAGISNPVSGTGSSQFGNISPVAGLAQSFTTLSAQTTIDRVALNLYKNGAPTDNLVVNIYAVDASHFPTGASLGTSATVAGTSLSTTTTGAWIYFSFATPISVSASTEYVLVITRSGAIDGTNNYTWIGGFATNTYAGGQASYVDNVGFWTIGINSGADTPFIVEGNTTDTTLYCIGVSSADATKIRAFKATDPATSWSNVGTDPAITSAVSIQSVSAWQDGNTLHVATASTPATSTQANYRYQTFDMTLDAWSSINEAIATAVIVTGVNTSARYISICKRSVSNEIIVAFPKIFTFMGADYINCWYSRRTAVNTWSAAVNINATSTTELILARIIPLTSDRVAFSARIFGAGTSFVKFLPSNNTPIGGIAGFAYTTISPTFWDHGGTGELNHIGESTTAGSFTVVRWADTSDNPTSASATVASDCSQPIRIFNDGTDTGTSDVWALYRTITGSDLYVKQSTDLGATWGTAALAMTATVASGDANLSIDADRTGCFISGSNMVIPYFVNDGGTLKYNEYIVRSVGGATSWAGSALLAPTTTLTADASIVSGPQAWQGTAGLAPAPTLIVNEDLLMATAAVLAPTTIIAINEDLLLAAKATLAPTTSLAVNEDLLLAAKATLAPTTTLTADLFKIKYISANLLPTVNLAANARSLMAAAAPLAPTVNLAVNERLWMAAAAALIPAIALTADATQVGAAGTLWSGSALLVPEALLAAAARLLQPTAAGANIAAALTTNEDLLMAVKAALAPTATLAAAIAQIRSPILASHAVATTFSANEDVLLAAAASPAPAAAIIVRENMVLKFNSAFAPATTLGADLTPPIVGATSWDGNALFAANSTVNANARQLMQIGAAM